MPVPYVILSFVSMEVAVYLEFRIYFILFCQGCMQQKEVHQFLIYWEVGFLHFLNGILNLGVSSLVLFYEKAPTS